MALDSHPNANTRWGDTLSHPRPKINNYDLSDGTINTGELNRNRDLDVVEFTDFELVIRDYVLLSLGHPTVAVELNDSQLKICIDKALSRMEYYNPFYNMQFLTFTTSAGQNGYELPQHVVDGIQYVVYKKTLLSFAAQEGTLEQDILIKYFQENFLFRNYDIGEYYLLMSHLEQVRKVLGREGSWNIVNNKYLYLYPAPREDIEEEVIVEYRALNSNTMHHFLLNWIQDYATAHAKEILGNIRGKYKILPSPDGGAMLDGPELRLQSKEEKKILEEKLLSEISDFASITLY